MALLEENISIMFFAVMKKPQAENLISAKDLLQVLTSVPISSRELNRI
jgi:hypothetical protein